MDIVQDPEILHKPCENLTEADWPEEFEIIKAAAAFVRDDANGAAGLAAPQVGSNKRWFVMRYGSGVLAAINPDFAGKGGIYEHSEGCLSKPGDKYLIPRYAEVIGVFYPIKGGEVQWTAPKRVQSFLGFQAAVFQHEVDHLNGKCCFDVGTPVT